MALRQIMQAQARLSVHPLARFQAKKTGRQFKYVKWGLFEHINAKATRLMC
jgi:hypothetical protein